KVEALAPLTGRGRKADIRASNSAAARRENVSTRRRAAGTPEPRRWATRRAKNSVLPVPGPARISWGPATSATASCQSAGWERTRASAGTDTRGDVRYGCGRADTSTQPRGRVGHTGSGEERWLRLGTVRGARR